MELSFAKRGVPELQQTDIFYYEVSDEQLNSRGLPCTETGVKTFVVASLEEKGVFSTHRVIAADVRRVPNIDCWRIWIRVEKKEGEKTMSGETPSGIDFEIIKGGGTRNDKSVYYDVTVPNRELEKLHCKLGGSVDDNLKFLVLSTLQSKDIIDIAKDVKSFQTIKHPNQAVQIVRCHLHPHAAERLSMHEPSEEKQTESGFTEEPEETLDDAMVRLVRKHGAFAVKDEYLQALLEVD